MKAIAWILIAWFLYFVGDKECAGVVESRSKWRMWWLRINLLAVVVSFAIGLVYLFA